MEDNMAATVAQPRFRTWLIGIFAALALLLAAVGIYGVMSYSVTQRTSEIGIRVTLGAQPSDVFRTVVGEGLRYALLGVGIGVAAGLALTRLLASFLYGISAYDPATFLAVASPVDRGLRRGVVLPGASRYASRSDRRPSLRIDSFESNETFLEILRSYL